MKHLGMNMNNISNMVLYNNLDRLLVKSLAQVLLNEHEILTLGREYGEKKWPPLQSLVKIVQDDLKKNNYTQFR